MANKVFAVLLVCIVVAATTLRGSEAWQREDKQYNRCYEACQKECQVAGNGYSTCEMKCDTECSNKETREKLKIKI